MPDISSLYSEKVMDHFRNPRNVGEMENPDGIGNVGNQICGDVMELYIKVDNGTITAGPRAVTGGAVYLNDGIIGIGTFGPCESDRVLITHGCGETAGRIG